MKGVPIETHKILEGLYRVDVSPGWRVQNDGSQSQDKGRPVRAEMRRNFFIQKDLGVFGILYPRKLWTFSY